MSIGSWLGIGKEISQPIDAVSHLYTTDKDRLDAEAKIADIMQRPQLAQIESNKLLIATGKFFNAGWIALLGWTSGFLILLFYAPQIIITTYVWGKHVIDSGIVTSFPMKSDDILNLIYLLFGTGALTAFKDRK
jgi:hypothetical protein